VHNVCMSSERFQVVTPEERLRAAEEIVAMRTGAELTPEEIGGLIAEERERIIDRPPTSSD
jgi:hypothetical protein